nr:topless-related protein 4-like isoform X2 [Ipomoea batatas]
MRELNGTLLFLQTMTTFMSPPPAATFLAFHPQDNNIIAIGMEDSSIQIYNVRVDEVKTKLKGHHKRITGLAFSNALNVLVSSGADSQVKNFPKGVYNKKFGFIMENSDDCHFVFSCSFNQKKRSYFADTCM